MDATFRLVTMVAVYSVCVSDGVGVGVTNALKPLPTHKFTQESGNVTACVCFWICVEDVRAVVCVEDVGEKCKEIKQAVEAPNLWYIQCKYIHKSTAEACLREHK